MITIEAMLKEGRESGEPNPVRWGPYRKRRLGHRQAQREGHVKTEEGESRLQAEERDVRIKQPCRPLDLGLLASRIIRK